MHLAAVSCDRSITGPAAFIETNIVGTYKICSCANTSLRREDFQKYSLHHISTDEVYGDLPHPDEV